MNSTHLTLTAPSSLGTDLRPDVELRRLMDEWEGGIYRFLLSMLHDSDSAQDCAQDVFLRAYEALSAGKVVNASWLFTVARNRAMDEFRRRRRVQPDLDTIAREGTHDATDRRIQVEGLLAQLPPLDREVLYLFAVAGFKTDEIGEILGVRGTAVRQRLYRARERARVLWSDAA